MTEHTSPAPGSSRFEIGKVVSLTLAVYARNFVPFFLMAFVVNLPVLLYQISAINAPDASSGNFSVNRVLGSLIFSVLNLIVTGAILYGVYQQMRGQPFAMKRALQLAGDRILAIIGVSIVSTVLIAVGFVALIVPGIILSLMFAVAVPVTVVERLGPIEALGRSRALTEGHRLELLGLAVLVMIAMWIVSMIGAFTLGMTLGEGPTWVVLSHAFSVAAGLLQSVGLGVLYYELRKSKEGLDLNALAASFE